MLAYLIIFFAAIFTAVLIWWLHRNQQSRREEEVDRSAPLPTLNSGPGNTDSEPEPQLVLPVTTPAGIQPEAPPASTSPKVDLPVANPDAKTVSPDNWADQVKGLRESGDLIAALNLASDYFPRSQALQQAAVIRRQQIRAAIDAREPVAELLTELYHLAILADLYRSANPDKPEQLPDLAALPSSAKERYQHLGHNRFRLLNKGDVKSLEQLWGEPLTHHHAEALFLPSGP